MEAQLKLKETKKQLQKIIKEVAEALQPLSVEMAGQEQIQSLEIEHQRLRNQNQELKIALEIDKLTAEVIQAPLKIIRKGEKCEQDIEAIEGEPPLLPLAKKAKHDSQGLPELEAENFNPKNWKDQANTISSLQLLVELLISVLREVPPWSHPNLIPEFSRHRLCAHLQ